MAESPSHRFGQIVGDMLEEIMLPTLQQFCQERNLFLDRKGVREARSGKKLSWVDGHENSHDLDFVIEKGGTDEKLGRPLAFIEAAWRRYTKHSRNKAQEIQGAILPLADRYANDKPFLGVVLAGQFTDNSLAQLRSSGFKTVLFPYESIVEAFDVVKINARFDEKTEDEVFKSAVSAIESMKASDPARWTLLKTTLVNSNKSIMDGFLLDLEKVLDRVIVRILIVPLSGAETGFEVVGKAQEFIENYTESGSGGDFRKYEIIVHFSNGDKVEASFQKKEQALKFLDYIGK